MVRELRKEKAKQIRSGTISIHKLSKKSGYEFFLYQSIKNERGENMGHKNKKSLICQVSENLKSKLAIGCSKHQDKIDGVSSKDKIYSYGTYNSYLQQSVQFVKWCKYAHNCKTLADCRKYADEYLKMNIDRGLSPYTLKLQVAALCKLYTCSSIDFIPTPPRKRKNITRSRNTNIKCETDFERFCLCTGLRRREITALRGSALLEKDGQYYIHIKNGKGGRERLAEVCGTQDEIEFVINKMREADNRKVFSKIPCCDIHAMRAMYAKKIYNKYKRNESEYKNERMILYHNRIVTTYTDKSKVKKYFNPDGTLKKGFTDVRSAYHCRDDKKNVCYDRLALLKCSQALGHNRASVVAEHYLYQ